MNKEQLVKLIMEIEPLWINHSKDEEPICTILDKMKHALGLDRKKPYHRHNRAFYKPYRNGYSACNDAVWEALVECGYANKWRENEKGICYYSVSDLGRNWLSCLLGIHIYAEED